MSRVSAAFDGRKALITYITAGDPSLSATEKLVYALVKAGADIVELGVPFSDPLADGPVIQASHLRAIKTSLSDVFKLVSKIRKKSQISIVLMLAENLIVHYGTGKFYHDAGKAGVDGVIVPDLPPEEKEAQSRPAMAGLHEVDRILLVAPTSSEERIKMIAEKSGGFVYLISLTGITGKRKKVSSGIAVMTEKIRKYTKLPIAVGFGISNPSQAMEASKVSDGVIVGSAIVDLIAKNKNPIPKVMRFVSSLRRAIDQC